MSDSVLGVGVSIRCDDPNFKDLGPNLDEAERLGVDYVELPTLSMNLVAGGRVISRHVRDVKSIIGGSRRFGVTAHGPIGINLMDEVWRLPWQKEVLHASLEVAAELGAGHYVMHTGIYDDRQMPGIEAAYAVQRQMLSEAGDVAAQCGLTLVVENVFTYLRSKGTALPSRLAEEIAKIDHPNVKACFDFSHGFINSTLLGADFLREAEALAPFAKHLHIHDSFGRPHDMTTHSRAERLAFGQGDLHLPLGWGTIPWDDLMHRVRFHHGVIFNIELDRTYWGQLENCIAATRALADRAKTSESPVPVAPRIA